MEQLDYLLGYAGVFLWAFGICQVKATRDKKRWLLSGILCVGVVLITFLYPKNTILYWVRLLLIFFNICIFCRRKMEKKSYLISIFFRFYRYSSYPYPDSDGYHRVHKKRRSESYVWNCF